MTLATEPRLRWQVPNDRHFDQHHQWIQSRDSVWAIGISDYTQDTAGDILYVSLPKPGDRLQAGQPFGSLESGKWVGQLYAPFSGVVIASNESLQDEPHRLNADPYGQWIIFAQPDPDSPLPTWQSPDQYRRALLALEDTL